MKKKHLALGAALTLAVAAVGYRVGKARADGVPMMNPLFYSGTLEDSGRPVEGTRDITIRLWDAATGGTIACPETTAMATPVQSGRFRVALGGACVMAIQRNPELWTEVVVGGTSLGRSKIGAVPYAVEAGRASGASGMLETRLATVEARSQPRQFVGAGETSNCGGSAIITSAPRLSFTASVTGTYRLSLYGKMSNCTASSTNACVGIVGISGYSGVVASGTVPYASFASVPQGLGDSFRATQFVDGYVELRAGQSYVFGVGGDCPGATSPLGFSGRLTATQVN